MAALTNLSIPGLPGVLPKLLPRNPDQRRADAYRQLLRQEAKMGGQLFGTIPAGHRREFFCLDEHTWVWHEEWVDGRGQNHAVTTHYVVRPNGVLKTRGDGNHQPVVGEELRNLYNAAKLYRQNVEAQLASLQA